VSVLLQMVDHYRNLREHTAKEIQLIEDGKLVMLRHGKNGTEIWKAELKERLAKIDRILETFGSGDRSG
jgi:hypothetical protein